MTAKRIDAHQHFWIYNPADYPWILDSMSILQKDYLPENLCNELQKVNFSSSIAVQARQSVAETEWLLKLALENKCVAAVVGWVDLCHPDLSAQLEQFTANPFFKGVRHVLQDEPDDHFMLGKEFMCGLNKLSGYNLVYDLLIFPKHLDTAIEFVGNFPNQKFVLDHMAKPNIKGREIKVWAEGIEKLAKYPNVYCKVSGLVTEADWKYWKPVDFYPYFDVVWDAFGEDRLMLGSDWPVCQLAASFSQVICLAEGYFEQHGLDIMNKVAGSNAATIYQL